MTNEELGKRTQAVLDQCKRAWEDKPWAEYRVIVEVFNSDVGRMDARYVNISEDDSE